jgi:hypothetical protein
VYSIIHCTQYIVTDVFSFFSKLEALDSLPLGLGKVYTVHYDFLLFKYTTNFREEKTLTFGTFVL